MRPSSFFRNLSSKLSSSPVTPWPPVLTAFDRWLTSELDGLRLHPTPYTAAAWLSNSLRTAIAAQNTLTTSLQPSNSFTAADRKIFDDYLEDVVDLLDACNAVRQRIGAIRAYLDSLAVALHHVECNQIRRARVALDVCAAMEKRCASLDTCGSNLRKLGERIANHDLDHQRQQVFDSEIHKMLVGSRAVTLLVVAMAGIALSFRTRRGVPVVIQSSRVSSGSWGDLLHGVQNGAKEEFEKRRRDGVAALEELAATVAAARRLRCLMSGGEGEVRGVEVVGELRRRCEELEEGVRPLEEGVDCLYRGLIDVRMCLLDVLSKA